MLFQAVEREAAVGPRGARGHGHRDEDHLTQLLLRRARLRRPGGVRIDAPWALRDVSDADGDQLLRLAVERARGEGLAVEVEECAIRLGRQLAHALELPPHVDTVKRHPDLLSSVTPL